MDPASFTPKVFDPNAPKVLDLELSQKLIRAAPKLGRTPNGDIVVQMGEQLACALAKLAEGSTAVVTAQNDATRYQREAETANREVATMNTQLAQVREERDGVKAQMAALEADAAKLREAIGLLTTLKPTMVVRPDDLVGMVQEIVRDLQPKKRGPKAKVVPMPDERRAAQ